MFTIIAKNSVIKINILLKHIREHLKKKKSAYPYFQTKDM